MRKGGGWRTGGRGIGRGVSARAREGRRPTPIVSRGFRATRACDRVPRGGRTISATALDARRRERAGRTARREARKGARRPNAVRRAAETCAVERASDMESGAGGQKPSRPGGRPCWTAHAEKTGRAPRATPRGPFYFPRARFRCSRRLPRPETRFVRGAFPTRHAARARASAASHRLARTPPSPRVRRHAPRPRRAPRRRRRRRRERRRRGLEALVGVARDQAGGLERRRARPRQRRERRRRERIRREPLQRGLVDATRYATRTRLGRKSSPESSPFAATEARLRAPRGENRRVIHPSNRPPRRSSSIGPAPNAIVSLPPPLSRSQSSASEPTAPDGPRIIPPPRRPRRAPRRALRDSRLVAAAATPPRPSPPAEAAAPRPTTISFPLARTLGSRSR